MKLPTSYIDKTEWILVGPMGPAVPEGLLAHPLIAVDGGARFADHFDIWVGDSDSHEGEIKADHSFHHPEKKDISDLGLAFTFFKHLQSYHLHLWGFTGGRKDHEIFNLGEALHFLKGQSNTQVSIYDSNHKLSFRLVSAGRWTLEVHSLFSLGCLFPVTFRLTGACSYQVTEKRSLPPLSSLGLSNWGSGEIVIETDGPLFIHFPEER